MVWVNPPNRVSHYSVIRRIRNVHSRNLSGFDAAIYKMFNHEVDLGLHKSFWHQLERAVPACLPYSMPGKYEKKAKTPFGHLAPNWLAELLKTQETRLHG
jgi:hypothetical protein